MAKLVLFLLLIVSAFTGCGNNGDCPKCLVVDAGGAAGASGSSGSSGMGGASVGGASGTGASNVGGSGGGGGSSVGGSGGGDAGHAGAAGVPGLSWRTLPSLAKPRQNPMGAAVDDTMYVIGGLDESGLLDDVETLGPGQAAWTT
jgi:hypothetical protein